MYIQAFRFTDPGEYRIVATYRGRRFTSKSSPAATMAFGTSIITAGASPNVFLEGKSADDRYGILPAKDFRPRAAAPHLHPPYSGDCILPAAPDRALTDTWSLKPKPTSTKAFTFAPKNGKSSSLEFKSNNADIATFCARSPWWP